MSFFFKSLKTHIWANVLSQSIYKLSNKEDKRIMNVNLIAVLVFFIILAIMFWIMNDKQANRVTRSLGRLLKVLPISQIMKVIIGAKLRGRINKEP